jgi:hypothetical protein
MPDGELAYLLVHDPDFRKIRAEDLRAGEKKVRLKADIPMLVQLLGALEGYNFTPYVVSAGPQEIAESALEGIIAPGNIFASNAKGHKGHLSGNVGNRSVTLTIASLDWNRQLHSRVTRSENVAMTNTAPFPFSMLAANALWPPPLVH